MNTITALREAIRDMLVVVSCIKIERRCMATLAQNEGNPMMRAHFDNCALFGGARLASARTRLHSLHQQKRAEIARLQGGRP